MENVDDTFLALVQGLQEEGVGEEFTQDPEAAFRRLFDVVHVQLDERVTEALLRLVSEFAYLIKERDDITKVLFPDAFEQDDEQNAAWHLIAGESLRSEKIEECALVLLGLQAEQFSIEELDQWLRVFNGIRLAILGREPSVEDQEALYAGDSGSGLALLLATAVLQALLQLS